MSREELSRRDFHRLASMLILGAVLAACTPEGQAQETKPAVTQQLMIWIRFQQSPTLLRFQKPTRRKHAYGYRNSHTRNYHHAGSNDSGRNSG